MIYSSQSALKAKAAKILAQVINDDPCSIAAYVATEALYWRKDDPFTFLKNVAEYGCINGQFPALVMLKDARRFFDVYRDRIKDIRDEWAKNTGQSVDISRDRKNDLAWFAVEHEAYKLCCMIEEA